MTRVARARPGASPTDNQFRRDYRQLPAICSSNLLRFVGPTSLGLLDQLPWVCWTNFLGPVGFTSLGLLDRLTSWRCVWAGGRRCRVRKMVRAAQDSNQGGFKATPTSRAPYHPPQRSCATFLEGSMCVWAGGRRCRVRKKKRPAPDSNQRGFEATPTSRLTYHSPKRSCAKSRPGLPGRARERRQLERQPVPSRPQPSSCAL